MILEQREPGKKRFPCTWLIYSPTVRALGALSVVFVIGLVFNADEAFFKWGTHRDMLRAVSVYGILACGMTLVIIAGGIDLGVGSILALNSRNCLSKGKE